MGLIMKFSANLGFLWQELSLPDAIRAAKTAGFDAVECHWPYTTPAEEIRQALEDTQLTMLGLNTVRGDLSKGQNGLSALPNFKTEAKAAIDQAIDYAVAINTPNIHVMAGFASGDEAHKTFINNLNYATEKAQQHYITILIEPLNHHDAPNYFLQTSKQAKDIIEEVNKENLKLMFDCYHLQIMEGDISRRLADLMPHIGHIQIASIPDRSEPDEGELNYKYIFKVLEDLSYDAPLGAEYKPKKSTENGLAWIESIKK